MTHKKGIVSYKNTKTNEVIIKLNNGIKVCYTFKPWYNFKLKVLNVSAPSQVSINRIRRTSKFYRTNLKLRKIIKKLEKGIV